MKINKEWKINMFNKVGKVLVVDYYIKEMII